MTEHANKIVTAHEGTPKTDPKAAKSEDAKPETKNAPDFDQDAADARYVRQPVHHVKPLSGSQFAETGEGSPVLKPGQTGRVVTDDGYELTVTERLALLEGDKPSFGNRV